MRFSAAGIQAFESLIYAVLQLGPTLRCGCGGLFQFLPCGRQILIQFYGRRIDVGRRDLIVEFDLQAERRDSSFGQVGLIGLHAFGQIPDVVLESIEPLILAFIVIENSQYNLLNIFLNTFITIESGKEAIWPFRDSRNIGSVKGLFLQLKRPIAAIGTCVRPSH